MVYLHRVLAAAQASALTLGNRLYLFLSIILSITLSK